MDMAERTGRDTGITFAALMFRLGPEGGTSLKRVAEVGEDRYDSEGEGTGSTELSDIRLLGRCRREKIFSTTVNTRLKSVWSE